MEIQWATLLPYTIIQTHRDPKFGHKERPDTVTKYNWRFVDWYPRDENLEVSREFKWDVNGELYRKIISQLESIICEDTNEGILEVVMNSLRMSWINKSKSSLFFNGFSSLNSPVLIDDWNYSYLVWKDFKVIWNRQSALTRTSILVREKDGTKGNLYQEWEDKPLLRIWEPWALEDTNLPQKLVQPVDQFFDDWVLRVLKKVHEELKVNLSWVNTLEVKNLWPDHKLWRDMYSYSVNNR
jgi:hypothetical protein